LQSNNGHSLNKSKSNSNSGNNRFLSRFYKNWHWVTAGAVVGVVVAILIYGYTKPSYEVSTTLLINPDGSNTEMSDIFEASSGREKPKTNVMNQIGIIKAFSLNLKTLENLGWNYTWHEKDNFLVKYDMYMREPLNVEMSEGFVQLKQTPLQVKMVSATTAEISCECKAYRNGAEVDLIFQKRVPLGEKFENEYFSFTLQPIEGRKPELNKEYTLTFNNLSVMAINYLNKMNVTLEGEDSRLLYLSYTTDQPARAVHYLNELSDVYIQFGLDEKNRIANKTFNFIDNQISSINKDLESAGENYTQYRAQSRIIDMSQQATNVGEKLNEIEKNERMTRLKLDYINDIQTYLSRAEIGNLVAPSVVGITDPSLQGLVEKLTDLNARREVLSYTVQENNPQLLTLEKEIAYTKNVLEENIGNLLSNTRSELNNLIAQKAEINQQLSSLPQKEQQLVNIRRGYELNNELYTFLLQRRAEVGIAKASNNPDAQILDPARLETSIPMGPVLFQWVIIGLVLGLAIPTAVIFVADKLDTRIASVPEAENMLDVRIAGQLVHSKFKEELPVVIYPQAAITESFRGLRTNIQYMLRNADQKVIGVNSMYVREGKTFVSSNLSSILAINNKRVLLIDADMRKPRGHKVFKLKNEKGLSTFLNNKHSIEEVLVPSRVNNLDFIPAGPIPMYPAELINNGPLQKLVEWGKANYDYVVIDNAPTDLVSDSMLISRFTDLNVFVLRLKYSKKGEITSINKMKEEGLMKNIVVTLNDVTPDASGKSFKGYGYYREVKAKKALA
jgi:capsular exopolysaccharide synthesis family protein